MGKRFFGDRSEGLVKGGRCQQYLSEVRGVCEVGGRAGRQGMGGYGDWHKVGKRPTG